MFNMLNSLTKYCTPPVPDINSVFSALNEIRENFVQAKCAVLFQFETQHGGRVAFCSTRT